MLEIVRISAVILEIVRIIAEILTISSTPFPPPVLVGLTGSAEAGRARQVRRTEVG